MIQHVLAHYRYTPHYVMEKLTFAQTLLLFDGMAQYIRLTNPWGGDGEQSTSGSDPVNGKTIDADQPGATDALAGRLGQYSHAIQIVTPDDLPDDIRDLVQKKP